MRARACLWFATAAAAFCLAAGPARAAEGDDNCRGYIESLPVVITSQGVWCLDQDLATAMSDGVAVEVDANNVTIDCNGFKLDGQAAGETTSTMGIRASGTGNTVVRNCHIRGFQWGVNVGSELGGYRIESNRVEGSTVIGIATNGEGSVIRDNQVLRTGNRTVTEDETIIGIIGVGPVLVVDNMVHGVYVLSDGAYATVAGIYILNATGGRVTGNDLAILNVNGNGIVRGIHAPGGGGLVIDRNTIAAYGGSIGVRCETAGHVARDNTMTDFDAALYFCVDGGGNLLY